jgi:NAD(P) transhydrogenase subunit alpha
MAIRIGVPRERVSDERRVAIDPGVAERFAKLGAEVLIERDAGALSCLADQHYLGARIVDQASALYREADILLKVQPPSEEEIAWIPEGKVLVGFMFPYRDPERVARLRDAGITSFGMELIPRISRAQAMDALSSQASVAGYKAGLMAADRSRRFFPMLTTAAGTIRPAKVLVIGAGVAGLQAIATCKRLGALVEAYDIRAAAKEQVESLGAKLVDTGISAESAGGYARELTAEEKRKQEEVLARHIALADAVITTASVPGRPAPRIVTTEMVEQMKPGSVVIDLAAEGGGNCELTVPSEKIDHNNVTVYGPVNVPSMLSAHASEMYARNLFNFVSPMIKDGELMLDWDDEVITESCLTHAGEIRHARIRQLVEGEGS